MVMIITTFATPRLLFRTDLGAMLGVQPAVKISIRPVLEGQIASMLQKLHVNKTAIGALHARDINHQCSCSVARMRS